MGGYLCSEAPVGDAWDEVVRLRAEGFAADPGRPAAAVSDRFDGRENCRSYLLTRDGEPGGLGTIRPCIYRPERPELSVPVFDLYPEAVAASLGRDAAFVQSTYFAVTPALRGGGLVPKLLLFREVYRAAVRTSSRFVITIVRSKETYINFYGKLGFSVLAEGRVHPAFGVPTALIGVEITDAGFQRVLAMERFAPIFQDVLTAEPPASTGG
jgi:hypothetical protein